VAVSREWVSRRTGEDRTGQGRTGQDRGGQERRGEQSMMIRRWDTSLQCGRLIRLEGAPDKGTMTR
jgi:hypothetical protein